VLQGHIDMHRTPVSNTMFSLAYPGVDVSIIPHVYEADIINLHWVALFFQSPTTLRKLLDLGRPVVWTLHDQWAFSGGCHFSAGCRGYEDTCGCCPQLSDDLFGLPESVLRDKAELLRGAPLTVVTPSAWLGGAARRSRLFRDVRIEVIPYSLETDVFAPQDKRRAKQQLGINWDTRTLLFGAEDGREKRKGYQELLEAVRSCGSDSRFSSLLTKGRIKLLAFGHLGDALHETGLPIHPLGYLHNDADLACVYAAADVFVLPSLEDNLPNTMLEAMSCGTPVVAFRTGGVPDVISHGVTGMLAPLGDTRALGEAILTVVLDGGITQRMSAACRRVIEEGYRLEVQAKRYLDLFEDLCAVRGRSERPEPLRSKQDPLPAEYCLELDLSVGGAFGAIEGRLRRRFRRGVLMSVLDTALVLLKRAYRSIHNASPDLVKRSLSKGVDMARRYFSGSAT
jgi:glycosyltransferase involved in cell wall biosynthesis